MKRHVHVAATAAVVLLLIAATAAELRWDYAQTFGGGPSPESRQDVPNTAVVAMVDDGSFDAAVEAYGLKSLERPDFEQHVLVYVTMVYGSCRPLPESVTLKDGAVLIRLAAIDPDVACPQEVGISHGVIRVWRADLPSGDVAVRVIEADGSVRIEGTIPNGPALAATGPGPLPLAPIGLLLLSLGATLVAASRRPAPAAGVRASHADLPGWRRRHPTG